MDECIRPIKTRVYPKCIVKVGANSTQINSKLNGLIMALYQCQSCGAFGSRESNGDNCICNICGSPDDFEDLENQGFEERDLDEDEHKFGDRIGKKVK